jgi:L-Ala-D/L-Glu epimerase
MKGWHLCSPDSCDGDSYNSIMTVNELELRHVRIPLRKPIKHASHRRTETDNLVVRVTLADGTVGYGEGVPRDYVTGETIDSAMDLIQRSAPHSQLSRSCQSFAEAVAVIESFTLAKIDGDHRDCQGNAARCAVELALLDAFGRCFGEPLMNVTKLIAPELYEPRAEVRYSGAIMSASGMKARIMGWAMRLYGFRQVKIKVGIAGQDDPRRLAIIRRRVGSRASLRVDANEAWTLDSAITAIRAIERYGIASVEQPLKHEDTAHLPKLRESISTPIMLDESLCSRVDAEAAVQGRWCDLFNLRLSKCGGFIPTLRLAQFAKQHGIGYQLGCQVGETAILSAAGRHFATSVADIKFLEGSYDRHLVREALSTADITFRRGGKAPMLVGSGLGIEIDPARLASVTIRTELLRA